MRAELLNHMGDDLSVVNAARVSFDKRSDWVTKVCDTADEADEFADSVDGKLDYEYIISDRWYGGYPVYYLSEQDKKLIHYLAKHSHWTPFAHTSISMRMAAPVPIRTQCFKHKQGFVENEESRRYISSRPELFVPENFNLKPEGSIKQGSGDIHPDSDEWKRAYIGRCEGMIDLYEIMIEDGIAPEQARFVLPQGCIVNWIWTGNLYSFANFYNKRTDPHAQKEIQQLAKLVGNLIEPLFPVSWKALTHE